MKARVRAISLIALRLALGIGLVGWVLWGSDLSRIDLERAGIWVLAFSAAAAFGLLLEGLQLRLLLRQAGAFLAYGRALQLVMLGHFFNLVTPGGTGGDFAKAWYLMRYAVGRRIELGTVVAVDRGLAGAALLFLSATLALLAHADMASDPLLKGLMLAAGGTMAAVVGLIGIALALPSFGLTPGDGYFRRALAAVVKVVERPTLPLVVLLLASVRIGVQFSIFAAAAEGLMGFEGGVTAAGLAGLAMIANALPLTPGGLGVGEAAFERLFSAAGSSGGALLLLLYRAGSLPIAAAGLLVYIMGGASKPGQELIRARDEETIARSWATNPQTVLSSENSLST